MGILDEAIKEHLELKRQHGAEASELKKIEDEAFGPTERPGSEKTAPDPLAEAPTEFMPQPETTDAAATEAAPEAEAQEAAIVDDAPPKSPKKSRFRRRRAPDIADLQEPPAPDLPAEEEAPAMEHEAITTPPPAVEEESSPAAPEAESKAESDAPKEAPEAPAAAGPSTEERHAIADQPTELYDIEDELAASKPAPSEDELLEEEVAEPRLASVDPLPEIEDDGLETGSEEERSEVDDDEEEDDFFDEKRLSDELDQALEAPSDLDEGDEEEWHTDEHDQGTAPPDRHGDDLLDETPDFLESAPEDDQLWFEQKPPKDFDFDD